VGKYKTKQEASWKIREAIAQGAISISMLTDSSHHKQHSSHCLGIAPVITATLNRRDCLPERQKEITASSNSVCNNLFAAIA